jgi:hypothetical protein
VRIPIKPLSEDAYRYVKEIEMEFDGQAPDKVLLDVGTWIYLKENVIMKDRGIPFGDRGYSGVGDFSGMIKRLKEKRYSKILVRNLNEHDFIYDYWMWPSSSDIRRTLLENYHVSRRIKAVNREVYEEHPYYLFDQISILVPNTN